MQERVALTDTFPDLTVLVSRATFLCVFGLAAITFTGCEQSKPIALQGESTQPVPAEPPVVVAPSNKNSARPQSAEAEPSTTAPVAIQEFRPADLRRVLNDEHLAKVGIRKHESRRLKLYTDLPSNAIATIPLLVDQLFERWEAELGPLPPDRVATDFQMTGYLINEPALFREQDLIPEDLQLDHGRHRQNEFWVRNQNSLYYREHLVLHEATHCYMTYLPNVTAPNWYLEGMAEYFAVHQTNKEGIIQFGAIPQSQSESIGFGRIEIIREDIKQGRFYSPGDIATWTSSEYTHLNAYAWSWALCVFLNQHPSYRVAFRELSGMTRRKDFSEQLTKRFPSNDRNLATEWAVFASQLQYGFNVPLAAIAFRTGHDFEADQTEKQVVIQADRGWQSTELRVNSGNEYQVDATGQFTLGQIPKPWISDANGVTFRYFRGQPIGRLMAAIRTEDGPVGGLSDSMLQSIPLGESTTWTTPTTGTLYLRLNDDWNSLSDNQGNVSVTIRKVR